MIAAHIINIQIPALTLTDDAQKALALMKKNRCNCLPVVDNGHLVGFVLQEFFVGEDNINKKMSQCDLTGSTCIANLDHHFYDVLKIADQHHLKMVAVVDDKKQYQGVITVQDVIAPFSQVDNLLMQGGIVVLSLNMLDYSLAEIGRLVEENGAKILSSFIAEDSMDNKKIRLILKVNQTNLSHITATLERFGYRIIGQYRNNKKTDDVYADRIDLLMHYLTM